MDLTIVCQDTRGGVQPYAALARGLVAAGHAVRAVAPADYAWLLGASRRPLPGVAGNGRRSRAAGRPRGAGGPRGWPEEGDRSPVGPGSGLGAAGARLRRGQRPAHRRDRRVDAGRGCGGVPGVPLVRAELHPIGAVDGRQPGVFAAAMPGEITLSAAVTSDLDRARHTAEITLGRNPSALSLRATPLLREHSFGVLEGEADAGWVGPMMESFGFTPDPEWTQFNAFARATTTEQRITTVTAFGASGTAETWPNDTARMSEAIRFSRPLQPRSTEATS